jgi:ribosome-binding factor A
MSKRTQQVADEIKRVLSEVIQYEMKDPRVGFATVTDVTVSGDLQHAQVRISVMGDDAQRAETMAALERAKGFLRRRVAQELNYLRFNPELHLHLDTSLDYSLRIQEVLQKIHEEQAAPSPKEE